MNSIYLEKIKFNGKNVKMQRNAKQAINLNQNGGAIYCYNVLSFYAESFDIQDSNALSGGAISFEE